MLDPAVHTQATFRTVLDAMARPGTPRALPMIDRVCPVRSCRAAAAVLLTLLDHEVTFAVLAPGPSDESREAIAAYLAGATGSRQVPAAEADFILAMGSLPRAALASLKRGSPAYPDEGATVLVQTGRVSASPSVAVELSGPGIESASVRGLLVGLDADDVRALAIVNGEPPCGVDLMLVDAEGQITCLPRSTAVGTI